MKGKNEDVRNYNFNSIDEDKQRELISKGNRPKAKKPGDKKGRTGSSKEHQ
jgi:hypothetical protein